MKISKLNFFIRITLGIFFLGWLLLLVGILSTPRDFSSPDVIIRLVDENDSPLPGISVTRDWYDSDKGTEGYDMVVSDPKGIAKFSKVPANVGLFTGTWKKTYTFFGMCGSGSGTSTKISVCYNGLRNVVPRNKPLRPVGQSHQDPDGVWFYTSTDIYSNTWANLTFPQKSQHIDYLLSSKLQNNNVSPAK